MANKADFLESTTYQVGGFEASQAQYYRVCRAFAGAAYPFIFLSRSPNQRMTQYLMPPEDIALCAKELHLIRKGINDALTDPSEKKKIYRFLRADNVDKSFEGAQLLVHLLIASDSMQDWRNKNAGAPSAVPPDELIRPGAFSSCTQSWNEIAQWMKSRYDLEPQQVDTIICNGLRKLSRNGQDAVLARDIRLPHQNVASLTARPYVHG